MGQRRTQIEQRSVDLKTGTQDVDVSDEALNKPSKKMDIFEDLFTHNTQFFTSYNPDMIEEEILAALR